MTVVNKKKKDFPITIFPKGWPYSSDAPNNPKWRKDRDEFFAKNGNGWWHTQGFYYNGTYVKIEEDD